MNNTKLNASYTKWGNMKPSAYIKFIDPQDKKKYYIYAYVRGMGDMAIYHRGKVIGKKTVFDGMQMEADVPINALKFGMYSGHKLELYDSLEDLEGDLFLEAFLEM